MSMTRAAQRGPAWPLVAAPVSPLGRLGFDPWIPLMLFALLFGFSMDYQVFLISRIREEWRTGLADSDAFPRPAWPRPGGSSPPRPPS